MYLKMLRAGVETAESHEALACELPEALLEVFTAKLRPQKKQLLREMPESATPIMESWTETAAKTLNGLVEPHV